MKIKRFFADFAKGAAIGVAMIVPGVSGGTLAVLLKIYDKLIESISNLRLHFTQSVLYILPIALGAALAFIAAYFPLAWALENAPFPTVLLFGGLMAGSLPKLYKDDRQAGFKKIDFALILIPFAVVIALCFIPGMGDVDLSEGMPWFQYILVPIMGILASCALVVPGISGSMLMMIFGYYAPLLALIGDVFTSPLHALSVLGLFGIGIIVGFFTIAKIMQIFLKNYPRATGWAIFGFVVGSIPAIFITFFTGEYGKTSLSGGMIGTGVVLFILGALATYLLTLYIDKSMQKQITATNSQDVQGIMYKAEVPSEDSNQPRDER